MQKTTPGAKHAIICAEIWEKVLVNTHWAADRTIMLKMTSKEMNRLVEMHRPAAIVKCKGGYCFVGESLRQHTSQETGDARLLFMLDRLQKMTAACRVRTLTMKFCLFFASDPAKTQATHALALALGGCPALTRLGLGSNTLGESEAQILAGVLGQCRGLTYLDLHHNLLSSGASIAGVLSGCSALQTLILTQNSLGSAGSVALADVLRHCRSLTHLHLSVCDVRCDGLEAIAGAIGQCPELDALYLGLNQIRDRGAKSLAAVLWQCPALTVLDFSNNRIEEGGAESLADCSEQCTALTELNLSSNDLDAVDNERLRFWHWRGPAAALRL
jgi:Leucine-rich repeat (LRR) protein